jgi:hypothetical protein
MIDIIKPDFGRGVYVLAGLTFLLLVPAMDLTLANTRPALQQPLAD